MSQAHADVLHNQPRMFEKVMQLFVCTFEFLLRPLSEFTLMRHFLFARLGCYVKRCLAFVW